MNLYVERQPQAPGAVHRLVFTLANLDDLTVRVKATPERCGRHAPAFDGADVLAGRSRENDLAHATWEDAEWQ